MLLAVGNKLSSLVYFYVIYYSFCMPKFNQLEMVTTFRPYLQTEFGEDRCTQFRVIVVTEPLNRVYT